MEINNLPNIKFAIVGAYKAGSTSLKNYLGEHPNVATHIQLEFDYLENQLSPSKFAELINKDCEITPEVTSYVIKYVKLYRREYALKNLLSVYPDIKLVFLVRDPVERAYSAWKMEHERRAFSEPFEDIIKKITENDIDDEFYQFAYLPGLYGHWYQMLLTQVKKENITVIKFNDLKTNPKEICNDLFFKMGLENYEPNTEKIHNVSKAPKYKWLQSLIYFFSKESNPLKRFIRAVLPYHTFVKTSHKLREVNQKKSTFSPISPKIATLLFSHYEKDIKIFESLTGKDFPEWRKHKIK